MSDFVFRFTLLIFAIALILAGLIILPLPIPFGAIMIVAGVAILISVNETAANWFRRRRLNNPRFNQWISDVEPRIPGMLGRAIRRTSP